VENRLEEAKAHSPGQCPGDKTDKGCALQGQKRIYPWEMVLRWRVQNAFAPVGRVLGMCLIPRVSLRSALGYALVAPLGCTCYAAAI